MKIRLMTNDFKGSSNLVKAIEENTPYLAMAVNDSSGTHGHSNYIEIDLISIIVKEKENAQV